MASIINDIKKLGNKKQSKRIIKNLSNIKKRRKKLLKTIEKNEYKIFKYGKYLSVNDKRDVDKNSKLFSEILMSKLDSKGQIKDLYKELHYTAANLAMLNSSTPKSGEKLEKMFDKIKSNAFAIDSTQVAKYMGYANVDKQNSQINAGNETSDDEKYIDNDEKAFGSSQTTWYRNLKHKTGSDNFQQKLDTIHNAMQEKGLFGYGENKNRDALEIGRNGQYLNNTKNVIKDMKIADMLVHRNLNEATETYTKDRLERNATSPTQERRNGVVTSHDRSTSMDNTQHLEVTANDSNSKSINDTKINLSEPSSSSAEIQNVDQKNVVSNIETSDYSIPTPPAPESSESIVEKQENMEDSSSMDDSASYDQKLNKGVPRAKRRRRAPLNNPVAKPESIYKIQADLKRREMWKNKDMKIIDSNNR